MKKHLIAMTLLVVACNIFAVKPVQAAGEHAHKSFMEKCLKLGKSFKEVGEYKHAETLLLEALHDSHHNDKMAVILEELADLYMASDNMKEARKYLKRAIAMDERALGENHIKVAELEMKLGETYLGDSNYKVSEWHLNNALSIMLKCESEKDCDLRHLNMDIASCINDLAVCVSHTGSQKELQALLEQAGRIKANPTKHHFKN